MVVDSAHQVKINPCHSNIVVSNPPRIYSALSNTAVALGRVLRYRPEVMKMPILCVPCNPPYQGVGGDMAEARLGDIDVE